MDDGEKYQSTERSGDHDDDDESIQQPELSDNSRILHHHHDQNEKDNAEDNPNPSDEVDPVSSIPSARYAENNNPPSEDIDDKNPETDNEAAQEESDHHNQESIQEHGGNEGNNIDLYSKNKSDDDDSNLHSVNYNNDDLHDKEDDRDEIPDDEEAGHEIDHQEPEDGNEGDDHQEPVHQEPAGGNEGDHQVPVLQEPAGGNEEGDHQEPVHQEPAGGNEEDEAARHIEYRLDYALNDSISLRNFFAGDEPLHVERQSLYINYKRNCNNNNINNDQDEMKIVLEMEQVIEVLLGAYERCFEVQDDIIEGRIILQEGALFQIEQHFIDIYLCCIKQIFGEEGLEILEELRKDPTKALPVIMQRLKKIYEQCCESRSIAYSRYNFRGIYFCLDS